MTQLDEIVAIREVKKLPLRLADLSGQMAIRSIVIDLHTMIVALQHEVTQTGATDGTESRRLSPEGGKSTIEEVSEK